jgi:nucleoid-associated protein YgaU
VWWVKAGQSFWSVAESVLTARLGRRPTDAEVDPYWRALMATNRAHLAHPGNPDLLYVGQQLTLPPLADWRT